MTSTSLIQGFNQMSLVNLAEGEDHRIWIWGKRQRVGPRRRSNISGSLWWSCCWCSQHRMAKQSFSATIAVCISKMVMDKASKNAKYIFNLLSTRRNDECNIKSTWVGFKGPQGWLASGMESCETELKGYIPSLHTDTLQGPYPGHSIFCECHVIIDKWIKKSSLLWWSNNNRNTPTRAELCRLTSCILVERRWASSGDIVPPLTAVQEKDQAEWDWKDTGWKPNLRESKNTVLMWPINVCQ